MQGAGWGSDLNGVLGLPLSFFFGAARVPKKLRARAGSRGEPDWRGLLLSGLELGLGLDLRQGQSTGLTSGVTPPLSIKYGPDPRGGGVVPASLTPYEGRQV